MNIDQQTINACSVEIVLGLSRYMKEKPHTNNNRFAKEA